MEHEAQKESSQVANKKSLFREVVESVTIAVVLAVLFRLFLIEPFGVISGSMEPNLMVNDRMLVSKVNYYFQEPKRGDIVLFKYPMDKKRNFVKRLIAVGGETVAIQGGRLYIDGKLVKEDYLPPGIANRDFGPVEVPQGTYFMLGDNRGNSSDSREWGFVNRDLVVGKAVVIYWPLDRFSLAR